MAKNRYTGQYFFRFMGMRGLEPIGHGAPAAPINGADQPLFRQIEMALGMGARRDSDGHSNHPLI